MTWAEVQYWVGDHSMIWCRTRFTDQDGDEVGLTVLGDGPWGGPVMFRYRMGGAK